MQIHKHSYAQINQEHAEKVVEKFHGLNHKNYLMVDQEGDFHCVGLLRKIWECFKGSLGFKNHTEYFWVAAHAHTFVEDLSKHSFYDEEAVKTIREFVHRTIFRREVQYDRFDKKLEALSSPKDQKKLLKETFECAIKQSNPRLFFKQHLSNLAKDNKYLKNNQKYIERQFLDCLPSTLFLTPEERLQEIAGIANNYKLVCFDQAGPTACLGNAAICPQGISIWGKKFRCAEAAFQWSKYNRAGVDKKTLAKFFTCDAKEAMRISRQLQHVKLDEDWLAKDFKEDMWAILQAKFHQNPDFQKVLDLTGTAHLLAHSPKKENGDWTDGNDGTGQNLLGLMLMDIRRNARSFIQIWTEDDYSYSKQANEGLTYQIH